MTDALLLDTHIALRLHSGDDRLRPLVLERGLSVSSIARASRQYPWVIEQLPVPISCTISSIAIWRIVF